MDNFDSYFNRLHSDLEVDTHRGLSFQQLNSYLKFVTRNFAYNHLTFSLILADTNETFVDTLVAAIHQEQIQTMIDLNTN